MMAQQRPAAEQSSDNRAQQQPEVSELASVRIVRLYHH
jgi:hypothetical protein